MLRDQHISYRQHYCNELVVLGPFHDCRASKIHLQHISICLHYGDGRINVSERDN